MKLDRTAAARINNSEAVRLPAIARDVAAGLAAHPKRLPPYLFYDGLGSELFERITELPEYYLTRSERSIFVDHGPDIVRLASEGGRHPLNVVELGAGSATKTEVLLRHVAELQGTCRYWPVDVSEAALHLAASRLGGAGSSIEVFPLVMHHEQAFEEIRSLRPRQLVLFIGSSIGNYDPADAVALLGGLRRALRRDGRLLLGTDTPKAPKRLVAAYDDAQGVTARFNRNVLVRINRELGGHFVVGRFRHVALWNERLSRIEMHLESTVDQLVRVDALSLEVSFRRSERIHTESSYKYDARTVSALLQKSGFELQRTFQDPAREFAVSLARAA